MREAIFVDHCVLRSFLNLGEVRLAGGEKDDLPFWQKVPKVVQIAAGSITVVSGLLITAAYLGIIEGPRPKNEVPLEQSPAVSPQGDDATVMSADAIAGAWSGEARQRPGGAFEVRLEIGSGCILDEQCGSISVSNVPCFGDLYFHDFSGGRYEFSVSNFSPASGEACTPGAGEYLTPRNDSTLLYTTGYDSSIRGTLHKRD